MSQRNLLLIFVPGIPIFVYWYPRILIELIGRDNPWTSYLYQYTFGLIFFYIGLVLIRKSRAYQPGRGHDDRWYRWLIVGFIGFASLHAIWIWLAISIPVKGG